ncbi:hypothetical protein [Roseofilum sp. Belize Diploria]|uniref:hypothetical protein n=1 Tax=Roseofilum sp. Belize Diploria TaxID=2821501 RepID=UPI001B295FB5|nr:hypothetical protein [Roseofilum sp. Belize Diploria]MBP0007579.1 hypothetical protein [Roseofilum sp. Belize Diploria]
MTISVEVFILFLLGKSNSLLSELDKDLKGRDKELLEESVKAKSPRITDSEGKTAKSWNYDVNLRRNLRNK